MPAKSDFNEIVKNYNYLYNNRYIYIKSKYINSRTKICIICPKHGDFFTTPYNHLNGSECPSCKPNLILDDNSFKNKSNVIHNNKYDYSLVNYKNNKTKVKIICKKHNYIFEQRPNDHLMGQGCPKCKKDKLRKLNKHTTEMFIKKANKTHNNFFNYKKSKYNGVDEKVIIICPIHGDFEQTPHNHLSGQGCSKCKVDNFLKTIRLTKDIFIDKSNIFHNNFYDYSLVDYKNNKTRVKIICPKHGLFEQKPIIHMIGSGCPKCNVSKGEKLIINYLNKNNIKYKYQKTFENCKYKNKLRFDFYLPKYKTIIEYDGEQHFKPNNHFGGEIEFKKTKIKDEIKNNFCEKNQIKLLRIPFNELNEINKILNINLK